MSQSTQAWRRSMRAARPLASFGWPDPLALICRRRLRTWAASSSQTVNYRGNYRAITGAPRRIFTFWYRVELAHCRHGNRAEDWRPDCLRTPAESAVYAHRPGELIDVRAVKHTHTVRRRS